MSMADLDLYVAMDIIDATLEKMGASNLALPNACQSLIRWVETRGMLPLLLEGLTEVAFAAKFPNLAAKAMELKQALVTSSGGASQPGPHTNRLLATRPFLNRSGFCTMLRAFAGKSGAERIILVQGDEKSGKTYSKFIIAAAAEQVEASFLPLDLNEDTQEGRTDAQKLTRRLLMRLDSSHLRHPFDDLGQEANKAVYYTEALLGHLGKLTDPVWLVIDNVNGLHVDQTARDLVWRICEAVETGECRNLWLVLLGVNETDAVMSQQLYVSDRALPPQQEDVLAFLKWFLAERGKTLADDEVATHVQDMMIHAQQVATAPDGPSRFKAWKALNDTILHKCKALQ